MLLYTVAMLHIVSAALVVERREEGHVLKVQWLVYFIGEVLSDLKARYPRIPKLLYAVLITKCKLWHYFDAHPMVVMSSSGLGDVIKNQESTSRIAKWGLELMALDITYAPCTVIKSQALANLVAEWIEEQASTTPSRWSTGLCTSMAPSPLRGQAWGFSSYPPTSIDLGTIFKSTSRPLTTLQSTRHSSTVSERPSSSVLDASSYEETLNWLSMKS